MMMLLAMTHVGLKIAQIRVKRGKGSLYSVVVFLLEMSVFVNIALILFLVV